MTVDDLKFVPHSDMSIDDTDLVSEHLELINNGQFDDATALLNDNNYSKGFRASIFNDIQNRIKIIQEYLQTKEKVESDELISETEPTDEEFGDKQFWMLDY